MKKICLLVITILLSMFLLVSCEFPELPEDSMIDSFVDNNSKFQSALSDYKNTVDFIFNDQDIEDNVKTIYNQDYGAISMAQGNEVLYYAIINLYRAEILNEDNYSEMQGLNVEKKDEDTYVITFTKENKENIITIKSKGDDDEIDATASIEAKVDGVFDYRSEKLQLGEEEYAYQHISKNSSSGNTYQITKLYINGQEGRLSRNNASLELPDILYDNKEVVVDSFAAGGDRYYQITNDDFIYHIN